MAASTNTTTPAQQFNLRWNNHTNNIIQVFAEQLVNESLVDVTLSCQGKFIKAHKMVLSACSPYFQELFQVHQVQHPLIIINGMSFLDIKLVIDFMYHGEVKVQEGDLGGLLLAAETLQVKGLANVRNKYEKAQSEGSATDDQKTDNVLDTGTQTQSSQSQNDSHNEEPKSEECKEGEPADTSQSTSSSVVEQEFDDDLPATIKVEPPDIRDIDEEEPSTGWDSPRLIIDMKEPKDSIQELKRVDNADRKRPNILRQPIPSIRVASAHLELSDSETPQVKKEPQDISSSAKCFLWPKRQPKILGGSWTRPKVCKIPRPPNAFMIFANDWRRKLALEFPESNKEISVRLGTMWKNLDPDSKEAYYSAARKADEEHKQKYPGYYYSPKEARMRKGLKQRRAVAGSSPMDALRFVKVFMSSAEKNNIESRSLLRKLEPKSSKDIETELAQLPAVDAEMDQNGDVYQPQANPVTENMESTSVNSF